jgi:SAM-dependent methyltransferase
MRDWTHDMRRDWDARAAEDARYYVNCQGRNQQDADFFQSAPDILLRIRRDYPHLPTQSLRERRFLEIGCGLGRLMFSLAPDCGEIHGVDISPAMIAGAREGLSSIPHAHFHVTESNDLAMFANATFDLVYSFAVFQHIPDRAMVYKYLDEALRVLRPGGIFIAQFNGAQRAGGPSDTWAGVWFTEQDLLSYFGQTGWAVLSSEGQNTQYLWFTLRKPVPAELLPEDSLAVTIYDVKHPWGGRELLAGGLAGFAEVFIRDLPNSCADLNNLSASLGSCTIPVRYIGQLLPDHSRQVNVRIPEEIQPGTHRMALCWKSRSISNAFEVSIHPSPPPVP